MSVPERLVGRGGKVIWDSESNALPDPGALVREIRSPDGATGVCESKEDVFCVERKYAINYVQQYRSIIHSLQQ